VTAVDNAEGKQQTPNPWLNVTAADYDGHMREIWQAKALEFIFSQAYARFLPKSLAVLGCGTGCGLSCVDPASTERFVGVDLNRTYLQLARKRNPRLEPVAEWKCAHVESLSFPARTFDMVHAALLFEYIEWHPAVAKIARWLKKDGVFSVVLQLRRGRMITPTRYKTIPLLGPVHRLVPPRQFFAYTRRTGLNPVYTREVPLPGGKGFLHVALVAEGIRVTHQAIPDAILPQSASRRSGVNSQPRPIWPCSAN
jgi:SAM-dependent methyltransferase